MMSATTFTPSAVTPSNASTVAPVSRRLGAGAGLAFVLLIGVGLLLPAPPDGAPSGRDLADFFSQHRRALLLAGYVNVLAMVPFFGFACVLCGTLRSTGRGLSILPELAFGAATALFVSTLLIGGLTQGLVSRTPTDPAVTEGLWYAARGAWVLMGFAAALFAGAASCSMLGQPGAPRLVGMLGVLAAVLELLGTPASFLDSGPLGATSPLGFVGFASVLVWVAVSSVVMLRSGLESWTVVPPSSSRQGGIADA
jgi:hypothetical protein